MTASEKEISIIVIDPDSNTAFNAEYMLSNSLKKVVVINTKCLCSRIEEIKIFMNDDHLFKMLYGCDKSQYEKIITNFATARDVFYLGKRLFISEVVICYWKNKGFEQFNPTLVSSRHGLEVV